MWKTNHGWSKKKEREIERQKDLKWYDFIYSTSMIPQLFLWAGHAAIWQILEQYRVSDAARHPEQTWTPIFVAQNEHSTTLLSLPRWLFIFCSTWTARDRSVTSPRSIKALTRCWAFFLETILSRPLYSSCWMPVGRVCLCLFVRRLDMWGSLLNKF